MHGMKQLLQAMQTGQSIIVVWRTCRSSPFAAAGRSSATRPGCPITARFLLTISPPIMPTGTDWAPALMLRDAGHNEILHHCGDSDAILS